MLVRQSKCHWCWLIFSIRLQLLHKRPEKQHKCLSLKIIRGRTSKPKCHLRNTRTQEMLWCLCMSGVFFNEYVNISHRSVISCHHLFCFSSNLKFSVQWNHDTTLWQCLNRRMEYSWGSVLTEKISKDTYSLSIINHI